eukprot:scaffold64257_cov74-Cyclotella_meneghiniana.AAC.5
MSSAEKAIHYLSSHKISHSVVYDDPLLGLSAMSNLRGRPNGNASPYSIMPLDWQSPGNSIYSDLTFIESFDSAIDLKDTTHIITYLDVVFANPPTRNSATTGHNIVP